MSSRIKKWNRIILTWILRPPKKGRSIPLWVSEGQKNKDKKERKKTNDDVWNSQGNGEKTKKKMKSFI